MAVAPLVTVIEVELPVTGVNVKGATPAALRLTVCVAGFALSVIVNEPVLAPSAVGVITTVIVQEALTARLPAQLFVAEKSPPAAIEAMVKTAEPELVSCTV